MSDCALEVDIFTDRGDMPFMLPAGRLPSWLSDVDGRDGTDAGSRTAPSVAISVASGVVTGGGDGVTEGGSGGAAAVGSELTTSAAAPRAGERSEVAFDVRESRRVGRFCE